MDMTWPCWVEPSYLTTQQDWNCNMNVPSPYGGLITWVQIEAGQHTMRIEALGHDGTVLAELEETWLVD